MNIVECDWVATDDGIIFEFQHYRYDNVIFDIFGRSHIVITSAHFTQSSPKSSLHDVISFRYKVVCHLGDLHKVYSLRPVVSFRFKYRNAIDNQSLKQ